MKICATFEASNVAKSKNGMVDGSVGDGVFFDYRPVPRCERLSFAAPESVVNG